MTENDVKDIIANKINQFLTDPAMVKIHLFQKTNDSDNFEIISVSALVSHPEFASFGVEVTFRLPKF